jgi:hypothetical protein
MTSVLGARLLRVLAFSHLALVQRACVRYASRRYPGSIILWSRFVGTIWHVLASAPANRYPRVRRGGSGQSRRVRSRFSPSIECRPRCTAFPGATLPVSVAAAANGPTARLGSRKVRKNCARRRRDAPRARSHGVPLLSCCRTRPLQGWPSGPYRSCLGGCVRCCVIATPSIRLGHGLRPH